MTAHIVSGGSTEKLTPCAQSLAARTTTRSDPIGAVVVAFGGKWSRNHGASALPVVPPTSCPQTRSGGCLPCDVFTQPVAAATITRINMMAHDVRMPSSAGTMEYVI